MDPGAEIDRYLGGLDPPGRRLGPTEWGLTVPSVEGWPLDLGLRLDAGLLRVQAFAARAAHAPDPWALLHWNRATTHVRFATSLGRDVWVHAELPAAGVDEAALDALLGLVVEAAIAARRG